MPSIRSPPCRPNTRCGHANAEIAVLDACSKVGAAFVAFSPLARGFLTATLLDVSTFEAKDIRRAMPRFEPAHHAANLKLLDRYEALAREAECTPAQLALAWLLARAEHIVPIPGTRDIAHLRENLGAIDVRLGAELFARVDDLIDDRSVSGPRYNAGNQAEVDTECFEESMGALNRVMPPRVST